MLGARRHWPVWLLVLPFFAWAFIRVLGLEGTTDLVPLMALTPLVTALAVLTAGVVVALRNWAAALVAALAAISLVGVVLPRVSGAGEPVPPGAQTLDVLSANLYRGNADPAALVALVRRFRPDVLAVQELDPGFDRALRRAGIERFLPHSIVLLRLPHLPDATSESAGPASASTRASRSTACRRPPRRRRPRGSRRPFPAAAGSGSSTTTR